MFSIFLAQKKIQTKKTHSKKPFFIIKELLYYG